MQNLMPRQRAFRWNCTNNICRIYALSVYLQSKEIQSNAHIQSLYCTYLYLIILPYTHVIFKDDVCIRKDYQVEICAIERLYVCIGLDFLRLQVYRECIYATDVICAIPSKSSLPGHQVLHNLGLCSDNCRLIISTNALYT